MLSQDEQNRYLRHLQLNDFGEQGQIALKHAKVLVIGAGGLGSPVLMYLAAAGVGNIGIVDDDVVSISNLQRQILYSVDEIGSPKCICAKNKLNQLNPNINIETYKCRFNSENCNVLLTQYDLVIDATDNLTTRYCISRACRKFQKPMVYGSVCEYRGHVALFTCDDISTSYEAIFPDNGDSDKFEQPIGIIGALPGIIGSIQAITAIKYIVGQPVLRNQLLVVDTESMNFMKLDI